jgi:beta-glucosidase
VAEDKRMAEERKNLLNGSLYPFGHGLSYTTFRYSNLDVTPGRQKPTGELQVALDVENTGGRAGDEVVQLYLSDEVTSVVTYERVLRGFERIALAPGERKRVRFTLRPEDLMLLDREMRWTVEPGRFEVLVGASSEDIRLRGAFEIEP